MPYGKPGTMTLHTLESLTERTTPEPNTGCWLWIGGADKRGYGRVRHGWFSMLSHRLMYELATGTRPDGLEVCHRCDNPPCCNPDHLFAGTHADNMRDSARKGRTRKGEQAKTAKRRLTVADVVTIRARLGAGAQVGRVAKDYGLSVTAISEIKRGITWTKADGT